MDAFERFILVRYGFLAALFAACGYVVPSLWSADRAAFSVSLFDHAAFLLTVVLAFAALRVKDAPFRARLTLAVMTTLSVLAAVVLNFSVEGLVLLALMAIVSYLEWPRGATQVRVDLVEYQF